jgi:hypothetical protein
MKYDEIPAGVKITIGFFLFIVLAVVFNIWIKPLLGI